MKGAGLGVEPDCGHCGGGGFEVELREPPPVPVVLDRRRDASACYGRW